MFAIFRAIEYKNCVVLSRFHVLRRNIGISNQKCVIHRNVFFSRNSCVFYAKYSLLWNFRVITQKFYIIYNASIYVISRKIREILSKFYVITLPLMLTIRSGYYRVSDTFYPKKSHLWPWYQKYNFKSSLKIPFQKLIPFHNFIPRFHSIFYMIPVSIGAFFKGLSEISTDSLELPRIGNLAHEVPL